MNNPGKQTNDFSNTAIGKFLLLLVPFIAIAGIPFVILIGTQYFGNSTTFYSGIFACFVILILMLILIINNNSYTSGFFIKKIPESSYAPLLVILSTGWLTIICFGALTSALSNDGIIQLEPTPEANFYPEVTNFFLWHALELIPALDINDVFDSDEPFIYNQVGVSWLVLVFRIIIVWVIIKQIYQWIKWAAKKQETQS